MAQLKYVQRRSEMILTQQAVLVVSLGTTVRMASGKSALEARLENPADCQPVGVMAPRARMLLPAGINSCKAKGCGVHIFSARKVCSP